MTTEEVLNLIENLTATGYQHMDVSHEGTHILLTNTATVQTNQTNQTNQPPQSPQGVQTSQGAPVSSNSGNQGEGSGANSQSMTTSVAAEQKSVQQENPSDKGTGDVLEGSMIESPIVGTYYSAPTPEEDDFVAVGQQVKKGDVLCIIEAMKLMNEIEADRDGTILEILVTNEQGVEFGQPLFRIG